MNEIVLTNEERKKSKIYYVMFILENLYFKKLFMIQAFLLGKDAKIIKLESHSTYTHQEATKRIKGMPQNQK